MTAETERNYATEETLQDASVAMFKNTIVTDSDLNAIGDITHIEKELE